MTTAAPPLNTTDKRAETLAELQQALDRAEEAKANLGSAALKGDTKKARADLAAAKLDVEQHEAVLAELDRIDEATLDHERRLTEANDRVAAYAYAVSFAEGAIELIRLRAKARTAVDAARDAETRLTALPATATVHRTQNGLGNPTGLDECVRMTGWAHWVADAGPDELRESILKIQTVEQFADLKKKAEALLAEAESTRDAIAREKI